MAGGWKYLWLTLGSYVIFMAFQISTNIWLSDWTNENDHWEEGEQPKDTSVQLGVYFVLGFVQGRWDIYCVFPLLQNYRTITMCLILFGIDRQCK